MHARKLIVLIMRMFVTCFYFTISNYNVNKEID